MEMYLTKLAPRNAIEYKDPSDVVDYMIYELKQKKVLFLLFFQEKNVRNQR